MKTELQRIAIAEAMGWKPDESHRGVKGEWDTVKWFALRPLGTGAFTCDVRVPDYLNDLNAMREAEKILQDSSWDDYVAHLYGPDPDEKNLIHATAAQKAEAFLRTLGKWETAK